MKALVASKSCPELIIFFLGRALDVTCFNWLSISHLSSATCTSCRWWQLWNETETCKTLVHAFVTSEIDYCNFLLYGAPKYLLHRLQRMLNFASRIVYRSKKYDHITSLLMELHWLPTEQRINFKILLITFKVLHNQAPTYLIDLLTHYHPSRLLPSSAKNLLWNQTYMYNLKTYGGHSFAVAVPLLWKPPQICQRFYITWHF